jgi:hypothetical protein
VSRLESHRAKIALVESPEDARVALMARLIDPAPHFFEPVSELEALGALPP